MAGDRISRLRVAMLVFTAATLFIGEAAAQSPFDGLAERIEEERIAWGAPGLAIAVVQDDRAAFMGGFGVRDLATGRPVDENTLFHVGSTTKAFTAAAIGLLVDEGALGWDDAVVAHLPEFRVADPYVTRALTPIDLLTHRSGVQNTDLVWARGVSSDGFLDFLPNAEQSTSLRSAFEYNNGMYIAAGKLVEAVSGRPFTTFVRERLFDPLGMDRTTGPLSEIARRRNVAMSHDVIDGEMTPIGLTDYYDAGAAGLFYSSVSEYVNWIRIWLNEGVLGERRILPEGYVERAFTPHMVLQRPIYPAAEAAGADLFAYGLGWFLQEYRGRRVNMHTGSLDGMSAILGLMPEEDVGVVVFINADHIELRHALMYEVFDRVIDAKSGGEPRDWSGELREIYGEIADEAAARRAEALAALDFDAPPLLALDAYEGVYVHKLFGEVEVRPAGSSLELLVAPHFAYGLQYAGGHRFLAHPRKRYDDPFPIEFEIGGDNRPMRLTAFGQAFDRKAQ
ncbi:MAG: serine hydrolase [Parvularculaceae bacterium]